MAVAPTSTAQPLSPPVNTAVLNSDGLQSPLWQAHQQDIVDTLATLTTLAANMGVTDGSDATAGQVGEYMTASAAVALTSTSYVDVVSLDLTAGDWDVSGNVAFSTGSGTRTFFGVGLTGTQDTYLAASFTAGLPNGLSTATHRFNVTATTTVWVVAQAVFTGGAVTATGIIRARRAR